MVGASTPHPHKDIMGASLFNSGGSSIVADTKLKALQLLVIQANYAEAKRNRDNKNNQTNLVSYAITSDAVTTFTSTVTIPSRMVEDAVTGEISFVVEETFAPNYLPFTAGAGDLGAAINGLDAIIHLARKCTYLEKQIDPNVVVTQADQIIVTTDIEAGQYVVALNLPLQVELDAATGLVTFAPFDYLRILDF
jgi:hypothetical protein